MNWRVRSYEKELLDGKDISFEEIRLNMKELDTINHWLGGHAITTRGIRAITGLAGKERSAGWRKGNPLRIGEIGCGGGDNLRVIRNWAGRRGFAVELTGIDINASCVQFAAGRLRDAHFIESDYRLVEFDKKPDVIFSSLFSHHFTDDELVEQLKWMKQNSKLGFFINDLHRNPMAWWSIKILTGLFSKSRLVKNDAPLSVQRGFSRKDWECLLSRAGITEYKISWNWAFRWLVTVRR